MKLEMGKPYRVEFEGRASRGVAHIVLATKEEDPARTMRFSEAKFTFNERGDVLLAMTFILIPNTDVKYPAGSLKLDKE